MNSKEIKKEAKELYESYFASINRDCQYQDNFDQLIRQEEKQAEQDVIKFLQPWVQILEESIQWLANLAAILDRLIADGVVSNAHRTTWSLIGASCVHSVAIRRLVLSGLDSSARAILRSLDEYLMICIVLLYDREMAEGFQSAQNIDDANKFWYEKLRTKALRKRLNQIEKELGFDQEASRELREWRQEEIKIQSQSLHPAYVSSALAIRSICASDPDSCRTSILGCASALSEKTLNYACKTIWYFSRLGFLFLFNEFNGRPPYIEFKKDDEMHQMVVIGRDVLSKLNLKYWDYEIYQENDLTKAWRFC
jgi:hypothetical protein